MATYTFLATRIAAGEGSDSDLKIAGEVGGEFSLEGWAGVQQDLSTLTPMGEARRRRMADALLELDSRLKERQKPKKWKASMFYVSQRALLMAAPILILYSDCLEVDVGADHVEFELDLGVTGRGSLAGLRSLWGLLSFLDSEGYVILDLQHEQRIDVRLDGKRVYGLTRREISRTGFLFGWLLAPNRAIGALKFVGFFMGSATLAITYTAFVIMDATGTMGAGAYRFPMVSIADFAYVAATLLITYCLSWFTFRRLLRDHRGRQACRVWLQSFSRLERDNLTEGWANHMDR